MKEKWNYLLYLIWFSYLVMSAVIMFGHGFLLSRKTLSDISDCVPLDDFGCDGRERGNSTTRATCSEEDKIRRILANPGAPMVCSPTRLKVLFLLVDALRYDFTQYNPDLKKPRYYQNKLPVMAKTLEKWPNKTRLFRFMADPPTTTLQRVKALATGSLPTFIDASSNFAAMELQEDNVIDQVSRQGRAVLLGDDTWARLMPKKFARSYAMYSFHTWDLDTVDAEVDLRIYDELKKDDWDLIVAHYLGVDHAGHRYGPSHPEMARKLRETNDRLEKIIEILPPDVLLLVVGDHGMTENGDHGGESRAERTAALFAYRGSGLAGGARGEAGGARGEAGGARGEAQQTDLAPTLSAALGRPPPAPSLGGVLLPLLPDMPLIHTLLHYSNNLKQLCSYMVRYGEESSQVSPERLAALANVTRELARRAPQVITHADLDEYVADVRSLVDTTRAVFREVWVEFDSLSMLRALLLLVLVIFSNWLIAEGIPMERLPNIFSSSFVPTAYLCMALCVGMSYSAFHFNLVQNLEHAIYLSTGLVSGALTFVLIIMHWDGISQRWYEGKPLFYERFARVALFASAAALLSNSYIIEEGATLAYLVTTCLALMCWNIRNLKALGLFVGSAVVLAASRSYRGCREEQGDCWTSGADRTGQASRSALIIALGSMACLIAISRRHIGWRGHAVVIAGVLACAHWAVGWGSLGSASRSRLLARGAWAVICVGLVANGATGGVASALSGAGLLVCVGACLVLGAELAPAACLAMLSGFLALNIITSLKSEGSRFALGSRCSSTAACVWALLASYHFYGTGHHATLGHVRWAPAFHAGDPNHYAVGPVVVATLVALELFGMPFVFGVSLPQLVWRRGAGAAARAQLAAGFALALKWGLCFSLRVFAAAIAATVHCRHLMIWGVFTPKMLFEVGACGAALLGAILGTAIVIRHVPKAHRDS